eukprot:2246288-Amphidinium_carterae.1
MVAEGTLHLVFCQAPRSLHGRTTAKQWPGTRSFINKPLQEPDHPEQLGTSNRTASQHGSCHDYEEVAVGVLVGRLHISVRSVNIESHKCEFFEEAEDAPQFPGIRTAARACNTSNRQTSTDRGL